MSDVSKISKRTSVPSLDTLTEEVEKLYDELEELVEENLANYEEEEEKLKSLAQSIRKNFKSYSKLAKSLQERLIKQGCTEEAERVRMQAKSMQVQCEGIKDNINVLLRSKGCPSVKSSGGTDVGAWISSSNFDKTDHDGNEGQGSEQSAESNAVTADVNVPPITTTVNINSSTPAPQLTTSSPSNLTGINASAPSFIPSSFTSQNFPMVNSQPIVHASFSPDIHTTHAVTNVHSSGHQPSFMQTTTPYTASGATSLFHSVVSPQEATPNIANQNSNTDMALKAMSKHLLQQDMLKDAIDIFDGNPLYFWSWAANVQDYIIKMELTPIQILRFLASHTSGEPKDFISNKLIALGLPSRTDVEEVWSELVQRHGSSQTIAAMLRQRIEDFPFIKDQNDGKALLKLYDLCDTIDANMLRCPEMSIMNQSTGLHLVRSKLPTGIQVKWAQVGQDYEDSHGQSHPPFSYFKNFLRRIAKQRSNNHFEVLYNGGAAKNKTESGTSKVSVEKSTRKIKPFKTEMTLVQNKYCYYHDRNDHELSDCIDFRKLSFSDRKSLLKEYWLCSRCLSHHPGLSVANCKTPIECDICKMKNHKTAMHIDKAQEQALKQKNRSAARESKADDSKSEDDKTDGENLEPKCTHICGTRDEQSCSKTVLVEITLEGDDRKLQGYAIVDEHSKHTMIDNSVIDFFDCNFPIQEYTMGGASKHLRVNMIGQIVKGLKVRGVMNSEVIDIPKTVSCNDITDSRHEVATPDVARRFKHSAPYARYFPEFNEDAPMVLLIGRDCPRAMYDEKLTKEFPYVINSPLGYALVGNTCPSNRFTTSKEYHPKKTNIKPLSSYDIQYTFSSKSPHTMDIFHEHPDDEEVGMSQNDKQFLSILNAGVLVDDDGSLELPLPLKKSVELPKNQAQVFKRTENTLNRLKKDESKLEACVKNIQSNLDKKFIEQVPEHEIMAEEAHVNPIHIVTHAKKGKPRIVIDPNGSHQAAGLNDALLQGPNLTNEMSGVFLRFRENPVGFSTDIQDMFYNFRVPIQQRDLLRFYWFDSNDPTRKIVPYRYRSHPFGLTSSPGVANYALKLCVMRPMTQDYESAQDYVLNSFYVDDGPYSTEDTRTGIQIISRTIAMLNQYNLRLHKIMSNDKTLLNHFPESERAVASTRALDETSLLRVLGTTWDTDEDQLILDVNIPNRAFTKRGVLSCIGSIYDRIGLASPVTLTGRLFQRMIMPPKNSNPDLTRYGWDDELPQEYYGGYHTWLESLKDLSQVSIPRCVVPNDFKPVRRELHVFSDSSDDAIGYVAYLRSINAQGQVHVAFINASSKVAPRSATSIPRLELNAAVEAAMNAAALIKEMRNKPDSVVMYTDSLIILGYITNTEKRFAKYVERRVNLILHHTQAASWNYVHTSVNPADLATRPQTPQELLASTWLKGPEALWKPDYKPEDVDVRNLNQDLPEEKPNQLALKTALNIEKTAFHDLCTRLNNYEMILCVMKLINSLPHLRDIQKQQTGVHLAPRATVSMEDVATLAVRHVQIECFEPIIQSLQLNKRIPINDTISQLVPFLDDQGLIRVGGRLKNAQLSFAGKHPILLPTKHPFTKHVVVHQHEQCKHQGGHLTHASIRQAGFFVQKGKSLVREVVNECVICRKLRGKPEIQQMADLPADRLAESAPFTNVGIDVFGHFNITEGKNTRRHSSIRKVWVLILVCLPSRAIHLEPLPSMDTSAFLNALTRFASVRGPCRIIRSDQGSNFLGAINQMEGIDMGTLDKQLKDRNIQWILNPPHASHMGGSWERKIGSVRRVLEATFALMGPKSLSYDEFMTMLAQAMSVVNQTPLWVHTEDPNDPQPLTPAMLLTLRTENDIVREEYTEKDLMRYGKLRYMRCQYLADQFWVRWRKEYLHTLTERRKWQAKRPSLAVDDVVLIRDKQAARNNWPMGRVSAVKLSQDGLVRSATVQLASKNKSEPRFLVRPISELILLLPSKTRSFTRT